MTKTQSRKESEFLSLINNTPKEVRCFLLTLADEKYRDFSSSLLPGTQLIGVRLPLLRHIAKHISRQDWRSFLQESWILAHESEGKDVWFEEKMLHGMILGNVKKADVDELFHYCAYHIKALDNWSLCDSFCSSLKTAKKSPSHAQYVWNFLQPYFVLPDIPSNEFQVRFALVMLLSSFLQEENLEKIFEQIAKTVHSGYYVKMAKAWLLSMCYVHFPEKSRRVLLPAGRASLNLDEFTWKKTIQKIKESRLCTDEQRIELSALL